MKSKSMKKVIVSGSFDNLRSPDVRLLEEAARLGELYIFLWSDRLANSLNGMAPKFPVEERKYLLEGFRYVSQVQVIDQLLNSNSLPPLPEGDWAAWVVSKANDNAQKRSFCTANGLQYHLIGQTDLNSFPAMSMNPPEMPSGRKKVVVTGCYDWFHSGHLRFFEEASELGDLYVVAGSDQNVRLLKGEGHPMFSQDERRYLVQSVRFVQQALISSGSGWMDAEPEIAQIKPDLYVVNEDGDKPEKRTFCEEHGIEYVVLKRTPKAGLPRRQSTTLRGF
jgi:cytidyltransferase-like protein